MHCCTGCTVQRMAGCLREQFSASKFNLTHNNKEDFGLPQWRWPRTFYLMYRLGVVIYVGGWSLVALVMLLLAGQARALAFLTQWSFLIFTVYQALALVTAIVCRKRTPPSDMSDNQWNTRVLKQGLPELDGSTATVLAEVSCCNTRDTESVETICRYPGVINERRFQDVYTNEKARKTDFMEGSEQSEPLNPSSNPEIGYNIHANDQENDPIHHASVITTLPILFKLQWFLFNISTVTNIIVSLVYLAVLYPWLAKHDPIYTPTAFDINFHGIFALISITDLLLSRTPVHIVHVVQSMGFGILYFIFSLVYWLCDNENNVLYPSLLDWGRPSRTLIMVSLIIFLLMPMVQLLMFGVYKLRLALFRRVCSQ